MVLNATITTTLLLFRIKSKMPTTTPIDLPNQIIKRHATKAETYYSIHTIKAKKSMTRIENPTNNMCVRECRRLCVTPRLSNGDQERKSGKQ